MKEGKKDSENSRKDETNSSINDKTLEICYPVGPDQSRNMGNYKIQGNEGEIAETDRSPGKSDHITTLERCTVLSKT